MSRSSLRLRLPVARPGFPPSAVAIRPVSPDDAPALADLMLTAYRGTINDGGATVADAQAEIARLLGGEYGQFLPELSRVAVQNGRPVSAALLTLFGPAKRPLLAFSMTAPEYKRRGLARQTLVAAIDALEQTGAASLDLVVTDGNEPAEALYRSLGFLPLH